MAWYQCPPTQRSWTSQAVPSSCILHLHPKNKECPQQMGVDHFHKLPSFRSMTHGAAEIAQKDLRPQSILWLKEIRAWTEPPTEWERWAERGVSDR